MDVGGLVVALAALVILIGNTYEAVARAVDRLEDWLEDDDPEPRAVDEVHQLYLADEIDERELEHRLEVLVDDRARVVRDMADDVDGIGEELSRDIAREFDSVADLWAADAEDFERVDGIGEARAAALLKEVVPESHKRS